MAFPPTCTRSFGVDTLSLVPRPAAGMMSIDDGAIRSAGASAFDPDRRFQGFANLANHVRGLVL